MGRIWRPGDHISAALKVNHWGWCQTFSPGIDGCEGSFWRPHGIVKHAIAWGRHRQSDLLSREGDRLLARWLLQDLLVLLEETSVLEGEREPDLDHFRPPDWWLVLGTITVLSSSCSTIRQRGPLSATRRCKADLDLGEFLTCQTTVVTGGTLLACCLSCLWPDGWRALSSDLVDSEDTGAAGSTMGVVEARVTEGGTGGCNAEPAKPRA